MVAVVVCPTPRSQVPIFLPDLCWKNVGKILGESLGNKLKDLEVVFKHVQACVFFFYMLFSKLHTLWRFFTFFLGGPNMCLVELKADLNMGGSFVVSSQNGASCLGVRMEGPLCCWESQFTWLIFKISGKIKWYLKASLQWIYKSMPGNLIPNVW